MQGNSDGKIKLHQTLLQMMVKDQEAHQPECLRGEVGGLFQPANIRDFFHKLREVSALPYQPNTTSDVIHEAEEILKMAQEPGLVDKWEAQFDTWLNQESPLALFEASLKISKCTEATVRGFLYVARRYMKFTNFDPKFSKEELQAYLLSLDVSGFAPNTIELNKTALRRLLKTLEIEWPFGNIIMHKEIKEDEPQAPVFTREQMAHLISIVKEQGSPEQRYFWVLATTWGFRSGELGKISAKNFKWLEGNTGILTVQTLKRGKKRVHFIPQELTPYLKDYSYIATPYTSIQMVQHFHRWCKQLGFPIPKQQTEDTVDMNGKKKQVKGYGWHAIRHSVVTELVKVGVPEIYILNWMGWQSKQSMVQYYTVLPSSEADEAVRKNHPFIPLWTSW